MVSDPVPTPSRAAATRDRARECVQVSSLPTPSRRSRDVVSGLTTHHGTESHTPSSVVMSDSATPSHPVPTPSRTESATPSPVPSPYRDGDRVASPTSHTPTEDISAESDFRRIAAALVGEHGWNRATLIATAVRGYVYDRPNPGPYREDAEAIYRRLGWEQAALLACWFRDSRNWPSTNKPSGRRPGGWPGPTALSNVPRTEST